MIVNTDADNQYEAADIPKLVGPILRGEADMVVGDRQVRTIEEFSAGKKLLQRLGSWVVRHASATGIPDTTSGFRAYNREAALQMQVVSKFTYTLETIIQAGKLLVAVDHVPIRTNPKTRESRLFPSVGAYVRRNALTIFRVWAQYEPLKLFWTGALILGLPALALFIRFLVLFIAHGGRAGHVQSLILGAVLFFGAMLLGALGVIGDLLDAQRTLSQRTFERVRRIELQLGSGALALRTGRARPAGARAVTFRHARRSRRPTPRTAERSRYDPRPRTPSAGAGPVVPTGNTFDKYGSTNPVVRRLMSGFESTLDRLFAAADPQSVLDVGCGEGVLTYRWAERLGEKPVVGIDLPDSKLEAEWSTRRRANLEFRAMDGGRLWPRCPRRRSTSPPRSRCSSMSPIPRRTLAEMARVAARHLLDLGPPRAAVARAERGARRLPEGSREHPGPRQPLVQAELRARGEPPRRGDRGAFAVPVDDAAGEGGLMAAPEGTDHGRRSAGASRPAGRQRQAAGGPGPVLLRRPAPGSSRSGSPRPASSRSCTWPRPATCSIPPPTAASRSAGRSCS